MKIFQQQGRISKVWLNFPSMKYTLVVVRQFYNQQLKIINLMLIGNSLKSAFSKSDFVIRKYFNSFNYTFKLCIYEGSNSLLQKNLKITYILFYLQMSKKQGLQIHTSQVHDYQGNDLDLDHIIYSPHESDEKIISASKFQRILSTNLASKFISCWKSLKKLLYQDSKKSTKISNTGVKHQTHQTHQYQQKDWNHTKTKNNFKGLQIQDYYNNTNDKLKYAQTQQIAKTLYNQKPLIRTKSADLKYQVSRAQILYQIAEKLKKSKKSRENFQQQRNQEQILRRLSKLQHTIKQIRTTNKKHITHSVNSRMQHQNNDKQNIQILKMAQDISELRNDLHFMKRFNQQLFSQQLEKSKRQDQLLSYQNSRKTNHSPYERQHSRIIVNHIPPNSAPNNIYVYSYPPPPIPAYSSMVESKTINSIPLPNHINLPPENQINRNRINSYNIKINGIPQPNISRRIHPVPNYSNQIPFSNSISNSVGMQRNRFNNLSNCNFCGRSCNCPPTQQPLIKRNI